MITCFPAGVRHRIVFFVFTVAFLSCPWPHFAHAQGTRSVSASQNNEELRDQPPVHDERERARVAKLAESREKMRVTNELEKRQRETRFYLFGLTLVVAFTALSWLGWYVTKQPLVVGTTAYRGLVLAVCGMIPMLVMWGLAGNEHNLREALTVTAPTADNMFSFHMLTVSTTLAFVLISVGTLITVIDKGKTQKLGLLLGAVPPLGLIIAMLLRGKPFELSVGDSTVPSPAESQGPEITIYHNPMFEFGFGLVGFMGFLVSIPLRVQIGDVALLVSVGGVLLAIVMGYLVLHPPVRLRLSDAALYIGQYDLTIPWNCIAEVFVWEPNMKVGAKILLRALHRGRRLPAVIGVTLTETGSKRFGRPADTGIYKGLYKGCDVAIRTPLWNFMSAKVSQQGLIEELVKRTPHKTEYPDRTEPDRAIPDVRKRAKSALKERRQDE